MIVDGPDDCGKGKTHISWNRAGQQGPPGEQGPPGPAASTPDPACWDNSNRYVDCANGTVHDTVTGLLWLRNAGCLGRKDWASANAAAAALSDGECGLTDGSAPGDWRLPSKAEWEATIEWAIAHGCTNPNHPSLTDTSGTQCFKTGPQPFNDVPLANWSSSAMSDLPWSAHVVSLQYGYMTGNTKVGGGGGLWAWPVRDTR